MPKILRVAALLRVSTTSVAQEDSPQNQLAYIREEISRHSSGDEIWIDTGLVYEDELTGALVLQRPGIQRLLADVEAGKLDLVATKSISRLGRDTLGMLMLKRRLWDDLGIDLVALQDGYRASRDPELIFLVFADRAQHGRVEISQNVRTNMRQLALKGKWTAGMIPFGYRRVGRHKLEPHPETAPVVQEIFRMRAAGKGVTAIVDYLNNVLQVPAPAWWYRWEMRREKLAALAQEDERWAARYRELQKLFEGKRPLWHPRAVRVILSNTAYYGELRYYRQFWKRASDGKAYRVDRDPSEHIVIPCPPIVDRELWDMAQKVKLRRVARSGPGRPNDHLLSGLLRCGHCGAKMSGNVMIKRYKDKEYRYFKYVCRNARYTKTCSAKPVNGERLEQAVLERIREPMRRLKNLPATVPIRGEAHRLSELEEVVRRLEAKLQDLKDERRYYRNEHRRGRVTDAELDEELARIQREERQLLNQLSLAREQLRATEDEPKFRSYLLDLWHQLEALEMEDKALLKQFLVAAVQEIIVRDHEVTVVFRFSIPDS